MGLPGSGKTTLAKALKKYIEQNDTSSKVQWLNADDIRKKYKDWDFSYEGRIRQSIRMFNLANQYSSYVICDFVAPLPEMRNNFKADWTIWLNTIKKSRFEDTNNLFIEPNDYDFKIDEKNADFWSEYIGKLILTKIQHND